MESAAIERFALLAAGAVAAALLLSALFSMPYVFTAVGFTGWLFLGHLITIDDEFPGGWSNPDGRHPASWGVLAIKGVAFLALALAATSPEVRHWGG